MYGVTITESHVYGGIPLDNYGRISVGSKKVHIFENEYGLTAVEKSSPLHQNNPMSQILPEFQSLVRMKLNLKKFQEQRNYLFKGGSKNSLIAKSHFKFCDDNFKDNTLLILVYPIPNFNSVASISSNSSRLIESDCIYEDIFKLGNDVVDANRQTDIKLYKLQPGESIEISILGSKKAKGKTFNYTRKFLWDNGGLNTSTFSQQSDFTSNKRFNIPKLARAANEYNDDLFNETNALLQQLKTTNENEDLISA